MTADAKQEKKPGKVRQFVSTVFGWPLRLSLAAKAAWILALFLIAVVVAVWIVLLVSPGYVPQRHALTGWLVAAILLLLAVIPFVFYYALRLWLQGERSRFPDIDFAWNAGLEALGRSGLAVDETPIFLVLGSGGDQAERTLISATGLSLRVAGAPEGPAPLHWYAGPDAVYLFCTEAGWLSALARLIEKKSRRMVAENPEGPLPASRPFAAPPPPPASPRGTVMLEQFVPHPAPPAANAPGGPRDTVPEDESVLGTLSAQSSRRPSTRDTPRGTLVLGEEVRSVPAPPPPAYSAPPPPEPQPAPVMMSPAPTEELPALLPPQDSAEQLERLEYVCGLLARAREPLCPLNGILALLPFETIPSGPREAEELERAVKADVAAIQRETQLRCPVTALITGMEREEGFSELVRRVGPDRAAVQRFGRRFDARCLATREELGVLCEHVCGAFEDWVYTLFREQGALTRPGNLRLYGLLCKVRFSLKNRLTDILAKGFGYDQAVDAGEPTAFSGCYFAATGATPDRQAFLRGVFDKLEEEQEDVEWTAAALRRHRRHRRLIATAAIVSAVFALALTGLIVQDALDVF